MATAGHGKFLRNPGAKPAVKARITLPSAELSCKSESYTAASDTTEVTVSRKTQFYWTVERRKLKDRLTRECQWGTLTQQSKGG